MSVAGMDEVGRGSLAGPVSVGIVVVDAATRRPPEGLRDSKLLSPAAREALVVPIRGWAHSWAVGHAGPAEIDEVGILRALRLAGERALAALPARPGAVLLDGNHDWLESQDCALELRVKADVECASVAAASVLAKVARDALMVGLAAEFPAYAWHANKGYAAPAHLAALRELGPCREHRRSWRLPDPAGPIE